jgi:hypothetical protein
LQSQVIRQSLVSITFDEGVHHSVPDADFRLNRNVQVVTKFVTNEHADC